MCCSLCSHIRVPGSDGGSRGDHKERVGEQGAGDTSSPAARGSNRGGVGPPRPAALWPQVATKDLTETRNRILRRDFQIRTFNQIFKKLLLSN